MATWTAGQPQGTSLGADRRRHRATCRGLTVLASESPGRTLLLPPIGVQTAPAWGPLALLSRPQRGGKLCY